MLEGYEELCDERQNFTVSRNSSQKFFISILTTKCPIIRIIIAKSFFIVKYNGKQIFQNYFNNVNNIKILC